MSKSEIDPYRQMSAQDVRRWLTANCVVATAFTAVLFAIATNNFGRGLSPAVTQHAEATEGGAAAEASLAHAGE